MPQEDSSDFSLLGNFHCISNVLPDGQSVKSITPDTKVTDALKIMKKYNFSQLAVSLNNEVLGTFSYRSFSLKLIKTHPFPTSIDNLIVENFVEKLHYRSMQDGFDDTVDTLDKDDALLVGSDDNLQGILSSIDVLKYLHRFTKPFILISEIELTLRNLIENCIKPDEIKGVIEKCLSHLNKENPPDSLERLTFANYVSIISNRDTWNQFANFLFEDKKRVRFILDQINGYRNIVFHFKRKLSEEEISELNDHRDWLLLKMRKMKASKK